MTLLSIVLALALEQVRALPAGSLERGPFVRWILLVDRVSGGRTRVAGAAAWALTVAPAALGVWLVTEWLFAPLELLWNVAVLYFAMGYGQASRCNADVLEALREGDVARARAALHRWRGIAATDPATAPTPGTAVAGEAIGRALLDAHLRLFAPIAWFAVFGAAGVVMYRLGDLLRREAAGMPGPAGAFARTAFEWIDWVPARLTALSFAVVGDFEDALYCWRTQTGASGHGSAAVVLATGAGALGVRVGGRPDDLGEGVAVEYGHGESPDADLMASTVGLVWRAVVLWLFVVLLLTAVGLVSGD